MTPAPRLAPPVVDLGPDPVIAGMGSLGRAADRPREEGEDDVLYEEEPEPPGCLRPGFKPPQWKPAGKG